MTHPLSPQCAEVSTLRLALRRELIDIENTTVTGSTAAALNLAMAARALRDADRALGIALGDLRDVARDPDAQVVVPPTT